MRITWSIRAKKKVSEYGEYIAQDNPDAASDWREGILDEVERLKDFPEQGRRVAGIKARRRSGNLFPEPSYCLSY